MYASCTLVVADRVSCVIHASIHPSIHSVCVSLSLWLCGAVDVDELVTKFLESEDKNFSLFNYVNELNNEIEQVRPAVCSFSSFLC